MTYQATTGVTGDPTTQATDNADLQITLTPSITNTSDGGALGTAIASHVSGCSSCHDGSPLFSFPSSNYADGIRSLGVINFTTPGSSSFLAEANHTNSHPGPNHTASAIERRWIFECAP